MTPENDIGNFIKEKLETAHRSPSDGLWDRVQSSLDRRRKRRTFFLLFASVAGIVLIILAVTLSGENDNTEMSDPTSEIVETKNSVENPQENNTVIIDTIKASEILSEWSVSNTDKTDNTRKSANTETEEVVEPKAREDNPTKVKYENSIEAGSEVTTTYYYYDGETDSDMETTDKAVIDSILRERAAYPETIKEEVNKIQTDSLTNPSNNR